MSDQIVEMIEVNMEWDLRYELRAFSRTAEISIEDAIEKRHTVDITGLTEFDNIMDAVIDRSVEKTFEILKWINTASVEEQIEAINNDRRLFRYIFDPSDELQAVYNAMHL